MANVFTDKQLEFVRNWDVRAEFLEGTTKAGKTHIGFIKFLLKVIDNERDPNIVGIHYILCKNNNVFNKNLYEPIIKEFVPSVSLHLRAAGGAYIQYKGVKIYLIGFENRTKWEKIVGGNIASAYVDEINLADPYLVSELLVRIGYSGGYFLATANPDDPEKEIYGHLNRFTMKNLSPNSALFSNEIPHWHAWHMDFYYNPMLANDEARINEIKLSEPEGTIYYDTKVLGLRKKAMGLIWPLLDDSILVTDADLLNLQFKYCAIGVDTSYSKETDDTITFVYIGIDHQGKLYILDEFVHNNRDFVLTASELPPKVAQFLAKNNKRWNYNVRDIFVDNADANLINEGNKWVQSNGKSLRFLKSYKMKITDRIQATTGWIATGYYYIHEQCPIHFKEMKNYSWSTKDKMAPVDKGDHTINGSQYGWAPFFKFIGPNK